MTTSTPEKQDGLKALNDAIDVIQNKITSLGGVFNVQMAVSLLYTSCNAKVKIFAYLRLYFLIRSRKSLRQLMKQS